MINTINCEFIKNLPIQVYTTDDFILNIEAINSNEFQQGTITENYNMFEQSSLNQINDMTIYQSCDIQSPFNIVKLRIHGSFLNINHFINLIQEIKLIQKENPPNKNQLIQDAWNRANIMIQFKKVNINETNFDHIPLFIFIFMCMCMFGTSHYILFIVIILYRIITR
jgi:hypothetical protein